MESKSLQDITSIIKSIDTTLASLVKKDVWYKDPQWWAIIVALFLGIAGIFQDWIRSWFKKPKLKVEINLEPPDCHKIAMRDAITGQFLYDSYYFRFRVINDGNYQMEDVELMATELYKKGGNGRFAKIQNFLPLNLVWAHYHNVTMPKIQPKLFKHCDFAHIIESRFANLGQFGISSFSNVVFILDTAVAPNTGSHILLPGEYKIKVVVAANNVSPQTHWYKLEIKDAWDANEKLMLSTNISIKKIS